MPIVSVLVHLAYDDHSAARVDAAVGLARDHGARLVGLHVVPDLDIPAVAHAYIGTAVIADQRRRAREQAAEVEALFRKRTDGEDVTVEWQSEEGDIQDIVTRTARYVDVAVIGQVPPESSAGYPLRDLPEQVVLSAGTPVIVVPYAGAHRGFGRRAVVAWNGSREAARAVHDAIPLLARAEKTTVLMIDAEESQDLPGADIAAQLARHGVDVEVSSTTAGDISAGDALLSRVSDLGADLVVMGAYGRSRAREWIMGGVTRHMLEHMTVPVLMSH